MDISYDASKNARNIAIRGLSFDRVHEFDWSTALIVEDKRKDYGEQRLQAMGKIDRRLYVLIFANRNE